MAHQPSYSKTNWFSSETCSLTSLPNTGKLWEGEETVVEFVVEMPFRSWLILLFPITWLLEKDSESLYTLFSSGWAEAWLETAEAEATSVAILYTQYCLQPSQVETTEINLYNHLIFESIKVEHRTLVLTASWIFAFFWTSCALVC